LELENQKLKRRAADVSVNVHVEIQPCERLYWFGTKGSGGTYIVNYQAGDKW